MWDAEARVARSMNLMLMLRLLKVVFPGNLSIISIQLVEITVYVLKCAADHQHRSENTHKKEADVAVAEDHGVVRWRSSVLYCLRNT